MIGKTDILSSFYPTTYSPDLFILPNEEVNLNRALRKSHRRAHNVNVSSESLRVVITRHLVKPRWLLGAKSLIEGPADQFSPSNMWESQKGSFDGCSYLYQIPLSIRISQTNVLEICEGVGAEAALWPRTVAGLLRL